MDKELIEFCTKLVNDAALNETVIYGEYCGIMLKANRNSTVKELLNDYDNAVINEYYNDRIRS